MQPYSNVCNSNYNTYSSNTSNSVFHTLMLAVSPTYVYAKVFGLLTCCEDKSLPQQTTLKTGTT